MASSKSAVSVQEALKIVLTSVSPLGWESISITEAFNRVLYEDIVSDIMIPPLDCSAMDGYALMAKDTRGASANSPIKLKLIGEIQAGALPAGLRVSTGTAIRIMTGAPMPQGADSVLKVEDALEESGHVTIYRETAQRENYRSAGENIQKGDNVLRRGDRLSSADIGILASLNHHKVKAYRQPTVSIISTGDELAGLGQEVRTGQIRDVNAYALYSEIKKYNGLPEYLGIAKDTFNDTKNLFLKALHSDVVISTGGSAMGRYDFINEIYADLDIELLFKWVKVKPGKPCIFGKKGDKLFFGLPGNPVASLTAFIQFVRPALLRLMGAQRVNKPVINACLKDTVRRKPSEKVHLLRGYFTIENNEFYVTTTGDQKSSIFRSMSQANCLIVFPENTAQITAGEKVAIQLLAHDEIL
ncbi:hypothetical protein AAU61_09805 [Desulfocarbo indianensis]|nr:hypothetical protein AAU61_09805 [Desulfocarbo indianensis]